MQVVHVAKRSLAYGEPSLSPTPTRRIGLQVRIELAVRGTNKSPQNLTAY